MDPFEEDVFEAMSCYFPIDFSPPRGGSLEITKEDLVLGLRNCLSASELFAPLAMPLFIEKLDSDLQVNLNIIYKLNRSKGQLISERYFGVFKSLRKRTKFLNDFCFSL